MNKNGVHRCLWLSDTTFQRHVWEHLAAQRIYQPTLGDVDRAREHCRQLEYWKQCTDRAVHWIVPGGEKLEHPGRERDLAHQVGDPEAERYTDERGQGELEQLLRVQPTQREGQEYDDGNMDDVNGKCLLG
jgi:hypothetical protein